MGYLALEKLREAKLESDPYSYVIVPGFLTPETVRVVNATYPPIARGGSYPIEALDAGMVIKDVIAELDGQAFQAAVGDKFDLDLTGRPKMFSLRGHLRAKDGKIHTDSKDKIITVLLYLNERWPHKSGRLRLLRNGTDLECYVKEISPDDGTVLIFKRSDNSWHGHYPFEGQRRALQMNWMTGEASRGLHAIRHKLSALAKSLLPA